ncbi:MAG: universal stress protein [Rhizobacter sp.]|nr:universal stress protein [Rhizobacter sp.]
MTTLHTLLAATDLSAPSRHAAMRAALLAKQTGARLELVHVLEKSALDELRRLFGGLGHEMQERIRSQARETLAQLAADMSGPAGIGAQSHVLEGSVLDSSIAQAESLDASLLIVGVRGAGFMRHWLLGATAERLLRKTLRPVLVVKQSPHEAYRSVLVPIDFSPWSLGAIRMAQAVAPQATLILLHSVEMPFEGKMRVAGVDDDVIRQHLDAARRDSLARLHQTAADAGLASGRWLPIVLHGDAAARILEQEEEMGADLIVLGKHGSGVAEELLLGSVTKHVLSQARCDVLMAQR